VYTLKNLGTVLSDRDFDSADKLMAEAQRLGEALHSTGDTPHVSTGQRESPDLALARVLIERARIRKGRSRAAEREELLRRGIAICDEMIAANPDLWYPRTECAKANWHLIETLESDGKTDLLPYLNRAIELEPRFPHTRMRRARVWFKLGRFPEALEDLTVAVEGNPAYTESLTSISPAEVAACPDENFRSGILALAGRAIELTNGGPAAYLARASLHAAMNNAEAAARDRAVALAAQPDGLDHQSATAIANQLLGARKDAEALPFLDRAIELRPGADGWFLHKRRGLAQFRLGRFAEALSDIGEAVTMRPDDASNITWIPPAAVAACLDTRVRTEMLALADRSVDKAPGNAGVRVARGTLLAEFGQWDRARDDFEKAVTLGARDAFYVRYLHALTCAALHDDSRYRADCTELLQQFRDSRNTDDLHFAVWTSVLRPGSVDDFEPVLELAARAVELGNESGQSLQGLGAALFRAGRFDEARQALEKSAGAPANPLTVPVYVWYFLAMTQFKLDHSDEAREWFDKALAETSHVLAEFKPGNPDPPPWNRRLTLELLRAEAMQMFGVP
jgi:tetratricopeptide (TPR) repeat protein